MVILRFWKTNANFPVPDPVDRISKHVMRSRAVFAQTASYHIDGLAVENASNNKELHCRYVYMKFALNKEITPLVSRI